MTPDDHIARVRADGYTVLEDVLTPAAIAATRAELAPWLQGARMGRNDFEGHRTERVYALLAKAPSLSEAIEHPDVLAICDAFLQPGYLLSAALAINVHPGETPQDFHVDDAGDSPVLHKPRPPLGLSTIWAYDDFTQTNGATEVIPGSHLWDQDRLPAADEAMTVTMKAGSVLVFAGSLYHRGGANRSDGVRLATTIQYCMPWMRQIENMVLAIPPDIARAYSSRIQSLLGYDIVPPGFMGYVDGVHPKRLLDDAYVGRQRRGEMTEPPARTPVY